MKIVNSKQMTLVKIYLIVLLAGTPSVLTANGFRLVSQDAFAAASQQKAVAAIEAGRFVDEIKCFFER